MAKDALEKSEQNNNNTIEPIVTTGVTTAEQTTLPEPMVEITPAVQSQASERREIVKSAGFVMLGNLGSSVMGMVRQIVVTSFGTQISGPFLSALLPAQTFNDFLVNGSVSGALIPTFTDYAEPEKRDELRRLVFTLVNAIGIIMLLASLCFLFFVSPWYVKIILTHYTPASQALTLQFSRIIFFSLIALGPFAVLLAALYALKEFGWPAFATASYHVGIIIGAVVGSLVGEHYYGHLGLAFGVLLGAIGEIALLIPGMRRQRFGYMFVLDLKHPAIRRVLRLYGPVSLSFLVSTVLIYFDQYLAASTPCLSFATHIVGCGEANNTALRAATTLIQFPIGLVAAALSFAVLPTLSQHMRDGSTERFKETLSLGFRLGLLLMIPAAAGLIVLQNPIVDLVLRHGNYTPTNARMTAIALQNYAYQLPFVALDQLLIAAFYARKNTVIPVVVQFVSILGYLAVALPFRNTVQGMPMLALANTVQNSMHGIILLFLLRIVIGPLKIRETLPTILKVLIVTAAMVGAAWGVQVLLARVHVFSLDTLLGSLLTVGVAGGIAVVVFFGGVLLLKVEEINMLKNAVLAKLGRK